MAVELVAITGDYGRIVDAEVDGDKAASAIDHISEVLGDSFAEVRGAGLLAPRVFDSHGECIAQAEGSHL